LEAFYLLSGRIREIKKGADREGPVIYWMSRDQRAVDNWALLYAQTQALMVQQPIVVIFCLTPFFLNASPRTYKFMFDGLRETEAQLKRFNISFFLLNGEPEIEIPLFMTRSNATMLISDFDPLRCKKKWKDRIIEQTKVAIYEVDAHNIVPCWVASTHQEYAAYTFRPKIHRLLAQYLEIYPQLSYHPYSYPDMQSSNNWNAVYKSHADVSQEKTNILPQSGTSAAMKKLGEFLSTGLDNYDGTRNNPVHEGQSKLSPYLHFGQLSAQRVAIEVLSCGALKSAQDVFLEELIVRRELSDNYCYYNTNYDNTKGFPAWSEATLSRHLQDVRPYLYELKTLENAQTHDEAWNAAQLQLVHTGLMHGYMRMYWAKKLLEWAPCPESAMKYAIYLNDRYSLDGRDANGYAGIAWSIGGVHDRAWPERPVFGKIRYMNYAGLQRKFDIKKYVETMNLSVV